METYIVSGAEKSMGYISDHERFRHTMLRAEVAGVA